MFDYIEMRLELQGRTVANQHIDPYGKIRHQHQAMKVRYRQETNELVVEGSLPYFAQGHNFWFTLQQAKQAIDLLSDMLEIDLWQARVHRFEYGVVVFSPFSIEQIMATHKKSIGRNENVFVGRGKSYPSKQNSSCTLKIYKLWANMADNPDKVSTEIKQTLRAGAFNKKNNPIRCEFRELTKRIVGSKPVFAGEFFGVEFEERCQKHLLKLYRQIEQHHTLEIKGKTDTISILLALLSDKEPYYLERVLELIDRSPLGASAKAYRKSDIRKRIKQMAHKTAVCSLEPLIEAAFRSSA